jgi:hypothetical protein
VPSSCSSMVYVHSGSGSSGSGGVDPQLLQVLLQRVEEAVQQEW